MHMVTYIVAIILVVTVTYLGLMVLYINYIAIDHYGAKKIAVKARKPVIT